MLFREVCRFFGRYLTYFTLILCIPLILAILEELFWEPKGKPQSVFAFALTIAISLSLAFIFLYFGRRASGNFHRRESILIVSIVWLLTPAISALPFIFSHTLENPIDAYFEAMSGLTTTGATVVYPKAYDPETGKELLLHVQSPSTSNIVYHFYGTVAPLRDPTTGKILKTGVEAVGKALLFWRGFLQWIGGMGIVVLFISILPALSMGGRFLFEAEVSGPTKEGMTPRIKETASLLWKIYFGLTALLIILLMTTNSSISFFDALNISFSTISTGGFTIHNEGISSYHSMTTETIVLVFMILGSLNFAFYFHCLRGKIYRVYEPEFFAFLGTLLIGSILMAMFLYNTPKILFSKGDGVFTLAEAFRFGSFQAISAQTTTGYSIGNYYLWPLPTQVLLLVLIFFGGMSGSTAGGIKMIRHLILFRVIKHKIESIFRPDAVRFLKIGKREVSDKMAITVLVFFAILITFAVLGTFLMVIDGVDTQTAMGLTSSMLNNAGLSFFATGPTQSCAFLSNYSKVLSIAWMALGRLEFFVLLVLLVPAFWKGK